MVAIRPYVVFKYLNMEGKSVESSSEIDLIIFFDSPVYSNSRSTISYVDSVSTFDSSRSVIILLDSAESAKNLIVFAVSRVILYMAAGGLQPVLQKTLAQITPARKRGSVFGFASSTQGIGTMLAAAGGGVAMVHCGISGVFYIGGLFFLIMLPIAVQSVNFALKVPVFRHLKRKTV